MGSSPSALCSCGPVADNDHDSITISRARSVSNAEIPVAEDAPIIRRRITITGDLLISRAREISINLHERDLHQIISQIDIAHNLEISHENPDIHVQANMLGFGHTTTIPSVDELKSAPSTNMNFSKGAVDWTKIQWPEITDEPCKRKDAVTKRPELHTADSQKLWEEMTSAISELNEDKESDVPQSPSLFPAIDHRSRERRSSFEEKLKMFGGAVTKKRVKRQSPVATANVVDDSIERMRRSLRAISDTESTEDVESVESYSDPESESENEQNISELSGEETEKYNIEDMESITFETSTTRPKRRNSLCSPTVAAEWSEVDVERTEIEMLREMRRLSVCSLHNA